MSYDAIVGVTDDPDAEDKTLGSIRLLVRVCVSVVPTMVPEGAVNDVAHADPVETAIPAPGHDIGDVFDNVPALNDNPVPIVTAPIAVPLPCNKPEIVVDNVIAGVVVGLDTDPAKPFAVDTETLVTVPLDAVEYKTPPTKDNPDPTVTLLNPPDPFPYKIDVPDVAGA
jgi:hypothetical protein